MTQDYTLAALDRTRAEAGLTTTALSDVLTATIRLTEAGGGRWRPEVQLRLAGANSTGAQLPPEETRLLAWDAAVLNLTERLHRLRPPV